MDGLPKRQSSLSTSCFIRPLVYHFPKATHKKEIISFLCARLARRVVTGKDYEQTVLDREETTSTVLELGGSDSPWSCVCVCRPVIAAAILRKPVDWGQGQESGPIFSSGIESG